MSSDIKEFGPGAFAQDEHASGRYRLPFQLFRASKAFALAYEDRLRPLGLNPAQALILLFVGRYPGVTMARLAALASVTPQTMHRSVTTLCDRELVQREPLPNDRKSFGLRLTPSGLERQTQSEAITRQVQDIGLEKFTSQELELFEEFLSRYQQAFPVGAGAEADP